jgi:hypothetical protein
MGLPSCTGSAGDLIPQAKKYKQEHGCYREGICADRIYIITKNRNFCTRSNIRLSAMRLGRPPKDPEVNAVGVPSSGVIPPRTSGDRLQGWRCKGWAARFPGDLAASLAERFPKAAALMHEAKEGVLVT